MSGFSDDIGQIDVTTCRESTEIIQFSTVRMFIRRKKYIQVSNNQ